MCHVKMIVLMSKLQGSNTKDLSLQEQHFLGKKV